MGIDIKKIDNENWEYNGIAFDSLEAAEAVKKADGLAKWEPAIALSLNDMKVEYSGDSANSFEQFIESYLVEKDLSLSDVCQKLNITRPTLYSWMNGNSMPQEKHIALIVKNLDVTHEQVVLSLVSNSQKFLEKRFNLKKGSKLREQLFRKVSSF